MRVKEPTAWAVYRVKDAKAAVDRIGVCSQPEWEEMERTQPGSQTLIKANITNEAEAERLARTLQPVTEAPKKPRAPRPPAARPPANPEPTPALVPEPQPPNLQP